MSTPPQPPLPTFIIIGAQKSATRWLRSNLGKHPDVFTAPEELTFFTSRYRQGTDYYRSQFEGWSGEPIVGEATPSYMMWRHSPPRIARRIHETLPDVRLIAILRDPIERANSAMHHHIKRGRLKKRSKLVDVCTRMGPEEDRLCLVTGGWYAASLERYVDLFGDQLLVLLHDDVIEDPAWVYRTALEHIGADPSFVPPDLTEVVFSNQLPANASAPRAKAVPIEDRRALWPLFREDVEKLEQMIKRDLGVWDPTDDRFRWPPPPPDLPELHRTAMAWVTGVLESVDAEHLDDATPCPDWNVRHLIAHMVALMVLNATTFATEHDELDYVEGAADWSRVHRTACGVLERAMASPRFARTAVSVPAGMMSAGVQVTLNLINQVGHAWDLAVATGQDATIPSEAAEPLVEFADALFRTSDMWQGAFAEAVHVEPSARASDRLVARLGRDPNIASRV